MNLRGVRESGKFFAVPTYFAIGAMRFMVIIGTFRLTGRLRCRHGGIPAKTADPWKAVTLFLILRSFSAGCSAVTGMEVISNGVKAFRRPESAECRHHDDLDVGHSGEPCSWASAGWPITTGILPKQMKPSCPNSRASLSAAAPFIIWCKIGTMLFLVLAANSAFAGFPQLASILARDGFMPHQMANFW